MADKLAGNQVDSQAISEALELICTNFSFDCGLVYEIDQYNNLNLKERYNIINMQLNEKISVDSIDPECRSRLSNEAMSSIDERDALSQKDADFLKTFFASSVFVFSAVDENLRICGMVMLLNAAPKDDISLCEKELSLCLSMLGRYTAVRMYQNKLSFAKTSLESILDNTGIDIYVNDFYTHEVLYVNKSMAAPYGGVSEFMKHKCWEVIFPAQNGQCEFCPQKNIIDENGNPTKVYTWDYKRYFDGSWFRVFSAAFRWVDGRLAHVVSSADITDNKRNEELIQYMANYDSLTNLPNRRMLVAECDQRINNAKKGEKGYLLFFDIDGFKAINDNYGHDAGDEFLIKLGEFFTGIRLLKNSIYRNGGDEFVAIINSDNTTEEDIVNLSNFIHERFKKPWILKKGNIFCNTSIGVASFPSDGSTAEELLLKADQAMYKTKKSGGGGISFFRNIV